MQRFREKARRAQVWVILVLGALAVGCDGKAGRIYSPPLLGDSEHPPAVRIYEPADGAKFHAHADIRLLILATPHGTSLGPDEETAKHYADTSKWNFRQNQGDAVSVELVDGTNSLGARSSAMVSANMRSQHGEAVPMIVSLVGYPAVELIWSNAPAGKHTLTARATNKNGLTTLSIPVRITVLP